MKSCKLSTSKSLSADSSGVTISNYRIYEYNKIFIGLCQYDLSQQKTQFNLLLRFNFQFMYCIITGNYNSNFNLAGTIYCDHESFTINVFNTLSIGNGYVTRFIGIAK